MPLKGPWGPVSQSVKTRCYLTWPLFCFEKGRRSSTCKAGFYSPPHSPPMQMQPVTENDAASSTPTAVGLQWQSPSALLLHSEDRLRLDKNPLQPKCATRPFWELWYQAHLGSNHWKKAIQCKIERCHNGRSENLQVVLAKLKLHFL